MTRYDQLQQTALGLAFILGPILMLAAAVTFVLGIKVTPDGLGSVTEGVFGVYGVILFIPIYLELARRLGQTSPVFGICCAITGLLGGAGGILAMGDRVLNRGVLVAAGVDATLYATIVETMIPEVLAVGLIALLFPLTSILLGIGLLRAKTLAGWAAIALVLAGILFAGAQVTETPFGLTVLYPGACILWLAALAPLGLRYLLRNDEPSATRAKL
jgi:hypothetical protein